MCQIQQLPPCVVEQIREATPRAGDSAKKRRLTEEELLALASGDIGCPDSPYGDSDDSFPLSCEELRSSLPVTPVSPVRRRSSGSVTIAKPQTRASHLLDEELDIVATAQGSRPEFRTAKRTQAARKHSQNATTVPSLSLSLAPLSISPEHTVGPANSPNKYVLQDTIGEGSVGRVWSARDHNGQDVAIKTMNAATALGTHEVAAHRACNGNAHVLPLIEDFVHNGEMHMVMKRAKCDLLQQLQTSGPLTEEKARVHIQGLLLALEALHSAGYSHRDVKLENCLLSDRNEGSHLLLADFGTAAPTHLGNEPRRLRDPVGSMSYMAPEVLATSLYSSDYDGSAADLFSSGIVLYAMIAGEFPFECASPEYPTYERFIQGEHSWPTHFSHNLIDLIQTLLSCEQQRASITEALQHPWFCEEAA
jgi:hypothetical protein